MTPEERAQAALRHFEPDTAESIRKLLIEIIRQAEDDKVEEAALIADPPLIHRKGSLGLWRIRRIEIAERIRGLKSKVTG